jgi:hypothetical protein
MVLGRPPAPPRFLWIALPFPLATLVAMKRASQSRGLDLGR